MEKRIQELIHRLTEEHGLTEAEYAELIRGRTPEAAELLREKAVSVRRFFYGNDIYIRGLIEVSSICRNDCLYCGIRRSNQNAERYRLTPEEILSCTDRGYELGFRTFVMQGGEDAWFSDERLTEIIRAIKAQHPDCAVTLSLGERSEESYRKLREAGADRYLLRHETADRSHYEKLHPAELSFDHRMECLKTLKKLGFQTGAGFMVGSPFQTPETLAKDLRFIETFRPEMCGIGPFMPHHDTPFRDYPAGSAELTCFLLSVIRLIHPKVLLPATTALASVDPGGRELGILSGANVVMPNLSPADVRQKYSLYDNKASFGSEAAESLKLLREQVKKIGYRIVTARGDFPEARNETV